MSMTCAAVTRLLLLAAAPLLFMGGEAAAQPIAGGVDLFELHPGSNTHLVLESTFEAGKGARTFALKVDGGSDTRPAFDDVTIQGLWMPELAPGVKLGLGVRQDLRPGTDLTHAVAGVEAELVPGLGAEHYFFLSDAGDLTGEAKLVTSIPLGATLSIEPRAEFGWAAADIPAEELAGGLTDVTLSLRLRQKLGPNLDVYVGGIHEALVGGTADLARAGGGAVRITRAVLGAGFSF